MKNDSNAGSGYPDTTCSASSEKLAPCRIREDGLPEFDGTRWESGMHLMSDMVMERIPEPCWIRNGRSAMKIDIGESRIMGRGIMLGYDMTEFSKNVQSVTPADEKLPDQ